MEILYLANLIEIVPGSTGWAEIPASVALPSGVEESCIYYSYADIICDSYDYDINEDYVCVESHKGLSRYNIASHISEESFKGFGNLYINGATQYLSADDITVPKVYFKTPKSWNGYYVYGYFNGSAFSSKLKVGEEWTEIPAATGILPTKVIIEGKALYEAYKVYSSPAFSITTLDSYSYPNVIDGVAYDVQKSPSDIDGITLQWKNNTGNIYIYPDPDNDSKTAIANKKPSFKTLFMMTPSTPDWYSSIPMLSTDYGETGKLLTAAVDYCGWFKANFVNETFDKKFLVYSSTDNSVFFGSNINNKTPFSLQEAFSTADTLYYDATTGKITKTYPETEGLCSYTFTGIIYDTDASVNELFSEYQGVTGDLAEACIGVKKGIVKGTLGKDGKPQLNVGSPNALNCFDDDEDLFNTLFNYTPGKNEGSCYDFVLGRMDDGRWGYNSDLVKNGSVVGGFAPVEDKTDADVFTEPLEVARKKRVAEGPVAVRSLPDGITALDYVCNGPGWAGGIDCADMFVSDDLDGVYWDWSYAPSGGARWNSQYRNQHFCFESHASFTYRKGLNFTAIGDDDIWVFIAGKLVIDNGGAHLAAPGYVDLDKITDKNGDKLVSGETYDFDLFFCDRRTTMSNMTFKTNMYLTQKSRAELLDPCVIPDDQDIFEEKSSSSSPKSSASRDEDEDDEVSSSSKDDEKTPSSSSKKNVDEDDEDEEFHAIAKVGVDNRFIVMPYGKTLQIAAAKIGSSYTVFDLQGNWLLGVKLQWELQT